MRRGTKEDRHREHPVPVVIETPKRRVSGRVDEVELHRADVLPLHDLEAQLHVPVDVVSGADAEHETVVVAEIETGAADQLDVRSDHQAPHAVGPQTLRLRVSLDAAARAKKRHARLFLHFPRVHVPDLGVEVHVLGDLSESVAAEELLAGSLVRSRNLVEADPRAEEDLFGIESLGRGDGGDSHREYGGGHEAHNVQLWYLPFYAAFGIGAVRRTNRLRSEPENFPVQLTACGCYYRKELNQAGVRGILHGRRHIERPGVDSITPRRARCASPARDSTPLPLRARSLEPIEIENAHRASLDRDQPRCGEVVQDAREVLRR